MAIVKMKRLKLFALSSDRDRLLSQLQHLGCVEISEPADRLSDPEWAGLVHRDEDGSARLRQQQGLLKSALDIMSVYCPKKTPFLAPAPDVKEAELFDQAALEDALNAASQISEHNHAITQLFSQENKIVSTIASLRPWQSLDLPLDAGSTAELSLSLGVCPSSVDLEELKAALCAEAPASELFTVFSDREQHYLVFACHRSCEDAAMAVLKASGFTSANLKGVSGTAADNIKALEAELAQLRTDREGHVDGIKLHDGCSAQLKLAFDRIAADLAREEARERLLSTDKTFFMEGWVTVPSLGKLEALLSGYDCAWETADPAEDDDVPVQLKNNRLTSPLNMVTDMYSLPSYRNVDPNPLMAPFFILFYGIMLADMGYGLLMIIAGLVVLKKKKPKGTTKNLFELMFLCGISTFIWGALTGGFFCDAPYRVALLLNPDTTFTGLPSLFNPLNDTLMVLVGAMILGFIQVMAGMVISFVVKVRDGRLADGIWDEGTWWVIFIGLALMILGKGSIGGVPVVLCIGVLMLIVGSGRNAKGIGKVTAVFGAVYNGVTGYFSDILSYSRLMALMLAGSVIGQVFNTLGAIPGNIIVFIVVFLIGHSLNFGLNLLGCYVHDLRLQCLEFFGRFYEDGGRPFRPLSINTKYVNVISKEDN